MKKSVSHRPLKILDAIDPVGGFVLTREWINVAGPEGIRIYFSGSGQLIAADSARYRGE